MASIFNVPIVINSLDMVINVLENFDKNFSFSEEASDDFKAGFNGCKTCIIEALKKYKDVVVDSSKVSYEEEK